VGVLLIASMMSEKPDWFSDVPAADKAGVAQVNELLAKSKLAVTNDMLGGDIYVARFVRARKHDVAAAFEMLKANLAWREAERVDTIHEWFPKTEEGRKLLSFFPNQPFGVARGVPLVLEHMTLLDPAEVFETFTLAHLVQLHIYLVERDLRSMYELSCASGKAVTELIVVENMKGLGFRHLGSQVMDMMKALLAVDQANYPELLHAMLIINAPSIVQIGFRLLRPFIDEVTLSKIQIHGAGWKTAESFLAIVPVDVLPPEWGGEHPTMHWSQSGSLEAEEDDDDANATDLAIGASAKVVHELAVEQDGSSLFYEFEVKSHDIGFEVEIVVGNKKPKVLVAAARYSTPQGGAVHGLAKGRLLLTFDNSYSYITSKEVRLTATVRPPLSRAQKRKEKKNRKKEKAKLQDSAKLAK
jgi:hypothetical protein